MLCPFLTFHRPLHSAHVRHVATTCFDLDHPTPCHCDEVSSDNPKIGTAGVVAVIADKSKLRKLGFKGEESQRTVRLRLRPLFVLVTAVQPPPANLALHMWALCSIARLWHWRRWCY